MKKYLLIALCMLMTSTAWAGKSEDYFPTETYNAARVAYQMLLNSIDVETLTTGQEPAICWPFPIDDYEFYRVIQDNVNAQISALPKREQNRQSYLIGWKVWNALQQEFGCF